MATRRVGIGPIGEAVRVNVAAMRKTRGVTLRDLSEKMTETGHPMAHNTINEIERGARRVDVDDLVALAAALDVSPIDLLGIGDGPGRDSAETSLIIDLLRQIDRKREGN
jgi:transcriptional regulator with XRE-family HTH domain